jgi:HK97 family phage prohead protease
MIVEGYAFKYDSETVLYENESGFQYREVIERGALDGADLSDVPHKYNHNDGVFIVARTRNNSMQLIPDDIGLRHVSRIIDTQTGRDYFKMVKEGLIDKMSFAFTETDYTEEHGENYVLHRIKKFKRIWDVSGVDIPAYDATEIYARSIAILEKRRGEVLERAMQQKRKRMMLENKIINILEEN